MAQSFFVIMQKRGDGKIYADLHKTTEKIYFFKEEAEKDILKLNELAPYFHVVELVAETLEDWKSNVR